ncbi:MAG: DUF1846 family protein, partial [Oscillospiraceae bacterium]|nr:DUF1846 family protein [Oscillospiraceae bacterium]
HSWSECRLGREHEETAHRIEVLLQQLGVSPDERSTVKPAIAKSKQYSCPAIALELANGKIVTGRQNLMDAASGAVINGIKELAGIGDEVHLMSRVVLEPILRTKQDYLGEHSQVLKLEEVLIALSICAATNPTAELALSKLQYLRGCEAHSSCILTDQDASLLRRLGINCTSEPVFENNMLFAD